VFIGRLYVRKGVAQLIEIWSKVQRRRPGARLAIIGDGTESDRFRELRDWYGPMESIDFFGVNAKLSKGWGLLQMLTIEESQIIAAHHLVVGS